MQAVAATPPIEAPAPRRLSWPALALRQFLSPVTLILIMAATVATAVGDATDGIIIGIIVFASAGLGCTQELPASQDVQLLLSSHSSTVDVDRHGETLTLVLAAVRAGDELRLSAGDVVPRDCCGIRLPPPSSTVSAGSASCCSR